MSENKTEKKEEIKVEIVSVYPILSMNPNEFGRKYYAIIARTSTGELVNIKIPEDEYSKERLEEEIKKELEKLRVIKEQEITITL